MSNERYLTEDEKWLEGRGYKIVTTMAECAKKGIRWRGGNMYDRKMPRFPFSGEIIEDKRTENLR